MRRNLKTRKTINPYKETEEGKEEQTPGIFL